jgi:hypothetical protein
MKTEQRSATSGQRNEFTICDVCNEVAPKAEGILVSLERFRQVQHTPNSKLIPAVVARVEVARSVIFVATSKRSCAIVSHRYARSATIRRRHRLT